MKFAGQKWASTPLIEGGVKWELRVEVLPGPAHYPEPKKTTHEEAAHDDGQSAPLGFITLRSRSSEQAAAGERLDRAADFVEG
jgi:hypothetical protein